MVFKPGVTFRLRVFYISTMNKFILFAVVLFSACRQDADLVPAEDPFVVINYSLDDLETYNGFEHCDTLGGQINHPSLVEASGLAVSRHNPNFVWSHNDSGHPNRLFLLDHHGNGHGYFTIEGAGSRDYEDMCIGPGPDASINYIYLGDIGDNSAQYSYIVIYRFPEPDIAQASEGGMYTIPSSEVERFEFVYPDGPRDAETLMIDPENHDLYIVSKRDFRSLVYRAQQPFSSSRDTLEKLAQLPFNWAIAGDISSDGRHIAIKDFDRIYYWKRELGESVIEALTRKPYELPYILEPQGESFGWTPNSDGYFTLSEQSGIFAPDLYFYKSTE